jgi:hypothetical protein
MGVNNFLFLSLKLLLTIMQLLFLQIEAATSNDNTALARCLCVQLNLRKHHLETLAAVKMALTKHCNRMPQLAQPELDIVNCSRNDHTSSSLLSLEPPKGLSMQCNLCFGGRTQLHLLCLHRSSNIDIPSLYRSLYGSRSYSIHLVIFFLGAEGPKMLKSRENQNFMGKDCVFISLYLAKVTYTLFSV